VRESLIAARRGAGIRRGLSRRGHDARLGVDFLPPSFVVFGIALDNGAHRTCDLIVRPIENTPSHDEFGIDKDVMVVVIGRLDEKLRDPRRIGGA
jgi:hypothetical protein